MEETGSVQSVEENQADEGISASDVRNHKVFKSALGSLTEENQTLKMQLTEIQNKLAEDAKAKDIRAKEEQGRYEEVTAQLKAENESLMTKYQRDINELKLENALVMAGADEYFAAWAKQNYSGEDISDYVNGLKSDEKHSQRFNLGANVQESHPQPFGASPAGSNSTNWAQVKQDLQSRDPAVRDTADRKVLAYMEKHNKSPF